MIYQREKIIKTAPKKYSCLADFFDYVCEPDKKRLTQEERKALDRALEWHQLKEEMRQTREGQLTLSIISDEKPVRARRIELRDNKHYHACVTQSGKEIRCDHSLFMLIDEKEVVRRNF